MSSRHCSKCNYEGPSTTLGADICCSRCLEVFERKIMNETCPVCHSSNICCVSYKSTDPNDPKAGYNRHCNSCSHSWKAQECTPTKFWMVFNPTSGRGPSQKHHTREEAVSEAIRICRKSQDGSAVFVLETIGVIKPAETPIIWEEIPRT